MRSGRLTPTKIIMGGYLLIILTGAVLLTLPAASRSGQPAAFSDALFTAASATCVTGLVVRDTYTYWSVFGQSVILLLIQVGGLGFVTMALSVAILTRRKIGLRQRYVMQESIAAPQVGGIVRLTRFILMTALCCEGVGAFFLAIRLYPMLGLAKGLYFAVFHSVSAFCNAGFDLMGVLEPFSSLTHFSGDALVNAVVIMLIVVGGLGFFVWEDLWLHRLAWNKYRLQTKMVLMITGLLILGGTVLLFVFEKGGRAYAGKSVGEQLLISLFQAVTPRTAGFNTARLDRMHDAGLMLTMGLMLIGGSPGSTAGGVKTTTVAVLALSARSTLKKQHSVQCFGRRLDDAVVRNAATIVALYLFFFFMASVLIAGFDDVPFKAAMFEAASAIGTVGLSLGITPQLSGASRLILIFLMYFGRVGCLTILYAMANGGGAVPCRLPAEKVTVG